MRGYLGLAVLMAACTQEQDPQAEAPYAPPSGVTQANYAPNARLTTIPDLFHSQPDQSTLTGLRVHMGDAARAQLGALLPEGFNLMEALDELDGFGTTAGVTLGFTAPVDPVAFATAMRFVRVADGADVPVEITWTDDGATAILEPQFPLQPETAYVAVATHALTDVEGGLVWRSTDLDDAMTGRLESAPEHLGTAWQDALTTLGLKRDDIAAGAVFVTQSIGTQDDEVAAFVLAAEPSLAWTSCAPDGIKTRCEAVLTVTDVLGADGTLGADEALTSQGTYELPTTLWLPGDGQGGPFATVIHGHGLGGDRYEARGDAEPLTKVNFAVAAIDAPFHGDHPGAPDDELLQILEFFGITFSTVSMDVRALRDNFRLASWEKLQLAEALRAGFDVDNDGDNDIDGTHLAFSGHSLGAVMGPQFVAQDPQIGTAYLSVPGGRVSAIVQRSGTFAPLVALMQPADATSGDLDRFFPMLQTAIERGDPLNWSHRVLDGSRDVLVQQVLEDDIMPNDTTRALSRALGVQLVGEELQEVVGLAVDAAPMPVSGNVDGRTAVLYQYDDMLDDGEVVQATHTHIFTSDSNRIQMPVWFQTWRDDGLSVVIDPFDAE